VSLGDWSMPFRRNLVPSVLRVRQAVHDVRCTFRSFKESVFFFLLRWLCPSVSSQYLSQERHSDVVQLLLFTIAVFTVVTDTVICCFVYHIVSVGREGLSVSRISAFSVVWQYIHLLSYFLEL